jgi:4-amino-4-deoxy-L-arabinose transferase-like glycosyltransferase
LNGITCNRLYRPCIVNGVLIVLVAVLVLVTVILSWVPPVSRDALTHHLVVPKIYIENGRIVEIPEIDFSYYPMNLDLLYIIPLYFGNDILPKLFHFSFALLTAAMIFLYLRKRLSSKAGLVGIIFFLSTPIIIKLSITVYVDLGLVFFVFAAISCLFKWNESGHQYRYLILSAVCCGLALGTKYNGLVAFFLLALFVPYLYLNSQTGTPRSQLKACFHGAAYVVIALVIFSPWMIRNAVWTGNPVYPLYNKYFKQLNPEPENSGSVSDEQGERKSAGNWNHLAVRRILYKESWGEILLIPLRIFYEGRDDNPRYFDGKMNPVYLFLVIFAFFGHAASKRQTERIERRLMLAFIVFFLLISFSMTSIRIRYIAPVIPPLIILSVFGLNHFYEILKNNRAKTLRNIGPTLTALVLTILIGYNTTYIISQFRIVAPLEYIAGKIDRDSYITRYRPEYPVYNYINQNLSEKNKLLGLFMGNRRYYCNRQMVLGELLLQQLVTGNSSTEAIRSALVNKGFSHVIVRYDLLKKWAARFSGFERVQLARFFEKEMHFLYGSGGYGLYALKQLHFIPPALSETKR